MKSILTIDCGNRAKECAQGLACAIFDADETEDLDTGVGARYKGSDVNLVVDDEDYEGADRKEIFRTLYKALKWVIKVSKEGFEDDSPEDMLNTFSYPDEATAFYSNVKGKVDLTIEDLEFLKRKLKEAIVSNRMGISEAKDVIESAGLKIVSEAVSSSKR